MSIIDFDEWFAVSGVALEYKELLERVWVGCECVVFRRIMDMDWSGVKDREDLLRIILR